MQFIYRPRKTISLIREDHYIQKFLKDLYIKKRFICLEVSRCELSEFINVLSRLISICPGKYKIVGYQYAIADTRNDFIEMGVYINDNIENYVPTGLSQEWWEQHAKQYSYGDITPHMGSSIFSKNVGVMYKYINTLPFL